MLLSKKEGGNKKHEKGAKKWNNVRVKSKGAVVFPIVKMMVFFLFVLEVCMYVCFFKNTIKILV